MAISRFEDSIAWQKARVGANEIYKTFSSCKDYSFRDQICRAAVSSMNNVAEGFSRSSSKDMARFIKIAKGSTDEVKSMLYLAGDLNYIDPDRFNELMTLYSEISKIQKGLEKSIRARLP